MNPDAAFVIRINDQKFYHIDDGVTLASASILDYEESKEVEADLLKEGYKVDLVRVL